jgi:hypothetical protein
MRPPFTSDPGLTFSFDAGRLRSGRPWTLAGDDPELRQVNRPAAPRRQWTQQSPADRSPPRRGCSPAYSNEKLEFEGFWHATVERIENGALTLESFEAPQEATLTRTPKPRCFMQTSRSKPLIRRPMNLRRCRRGPSAVHREVVERRRLHSGLDYLSPQSSRTVTPGQSQNKPLLPVLPGGPFHSGAESFCRPALTQRPARPRR